MNPAFHDFYKVYVPYCSSDVHTGTRDASFLTDNYTFHGHYIFDAVVQDLIRTTRITQAKQVVLLGSSAGAFGTEANCDYFADVLHQKNASIDVRCVSDSGTLYPYDTHTNFCSTHLLEYAAYEIWNSITDASCKAAHPDGFDCFSVADFYSYIETPIMLLMSSEDTTIRYCYEDSPEFWDEWRDELAKRARAMIKEVPRMGMYLANCPFHGALGRGVTWDDMELPLLDGAENETGILKYLLANFLHNAHPFQAIDNMTHRNPLCNKQENINLDFKK